STAHSPLFQLMLAWQNAPQLDADMSRTIRSGPHADMSDLTLNLREMGECIAGTLSYATALFDEATVRRHWGYVQSMLHGMVLDDGAAFDRIDLLSVDERHQVLHTFNDTGRAYPQDQLIHELFEQQVQRSPEATALQFEDERLSYAELNARANQLAHHLRELG